MLFKLKRLKTIHIIITTFVPPLNLFLASKILYKMQKKTVHAYFENV